jgi:hypothetical protein
LSRDGPRSGDPRPSLRVLIGSHALCAAGTFAVPRAFLAASGDQERARLIVRILGFRHLAVALALTCRSTPNSILASASVDALHACSMGLLAYRRPRWRMQALASAAAATMLSAYGVRLGERRR